MPRPVKSGRKPIAKGTAIPPRPGLQPGVAEQGDAVDGDRDQPGERRLLVDRQQLRERPGRRITLPAIVRPRPTEIVTRTSATRPEARLASHQPCWSPAVQRRRCRR